MGETMKKDDLCTHPLDGRARLLNVQNHQQIIIERCTKCMCPEWVLEGREGIDYPKKFTQEEVDRLIVEQDKISWANGFNACKEEFRINAHKR